MEGMMVLEVKEVVPGKISFAKKTSLMIAAISIAPLIAFAVLWTSLLLLLGGLWLGNAIGLL